MERTVTVNKEELLQVLKGNRDKHEKEVEQTRIELEKEIQIRLEKYPLERLFKPRWRMIRYMANLTKYFSRMRENSRFYHVMGFYIVRKKILRIEDELIRQGKLKCNGIRSFA